MATVNRIENALYTLAMSHEEAQGLLDILGGIGGHGRLRRILDGITDALHSTGLEYSKDANKDETAWPYEGGGDDYPRLVDKEAE